VVHQRPVVDHGGFDHLAQQDGVIARLVSRMVAALQLNHCAIDHGRSSVPD
jgi:hypothetical protein